MSEPIVACPACGKALEEEPLPFQTVICPNCSAHLFVDIEGNVQVNESAPPRPEEVYASGPNLAGLDDPQPEEPNLFAFDPTPVAESPPENDGEPASGDAFASWAVQDEPPMQEAAPVFAPPDEVEIFAEPQVDNPTGDRADEEAPAVDFGNLDNFFGDQPEADSSASGFGGASQDESMDISSFANSEMSQAKDGMLLFRVSISLINSKEIRASIREAIEDQRFAWDADGIMSRIANGTLEIDRLTPVKATILINRIKRLPIKIRWEQYAITQSDSST